MALDLSDRGLRQLAATCQSAAVGGDRFAMQATLLLAARELRDAGTPALHIQAPPPDVMERIMDSLDIPEAPEPFALGGSYCRPQPAGRSAAYIGVFAAGLVAAAVVARPLAQFFGL